ncbi:MAG: S8 family serine peptidase [Lewinellaceae bacterium]|nr:S8 family serine peptidase [Lewinellaceae bacterium]
MIGYVLSFLVVFGGLAFWFRQDRRGGNFPIFPIMVSIGLTSYALSVLFQAAPADYKLQVIFRDLLVIAAAGTVFSFIARQRFSFLIGLGISLIGLWWFYQQYLGKTFPYRDDLRLDQQGELLVELKTGHEVAELDEIFRHFGLTSHPGFQPEHLDWTELDEYIIVDIPDLRRYQLERIRKQLLKNPAVSWVEENEIITVDPLQPQRTPTEISRKFGLNDPGLSFLWSFPAMEMDALYTALDKKAVRPAQKALVAILDTGVDSKHEDLQGNFRSLQRKYNDDPKGHGTHCAGIAGAVSNNGKGVASFSRDNAYVEITSIKVLNGYGFGTQETIIAGILEAADKGAAVISLSLGGPANASRQRAYNQAVAYANKAGAIVVAAAGNSNRNANEFSPANAKGIIVVSAVDKELNRAEFSNYVSDIAMGVAAPGVDIYSTIPGNQYATFSGTSMATPYVAGLVGLMKSLNPSLTTKEVFQILQKTGKDTRNTKLTGRFIQPAAAINDL